MYDKLKQECVQAIAYELPQPILNTLYDKLFSNLHGQKRFHDDHYQNNIIKSNALAQAEYFSIMDAVDSALKHDDRYSLKPTHPAGGHFPQIELNDLILIPRRSVSCQEWQKANYLKQLAKNNQKLNTQLDWLSQSKNKDKILVIMDVSYLDGTLYIQYLIPDNRLNNILVNINHDEVIQEFNKPINVKHKINPVAKLKKTLKQLNKKVG
ncbi:MAG: hypothetical protein ACTTHX_07030 [Moraxella sp.]